VERNFGKNGGGWFKLEGGRQSPLEKTRGEGGEVGFPKQTKKEGDREKKKVKENAYHRISSFKGGGKKEEGQEI